MPKLRLAFVADPNSIHTRRWVGYFAQQGHDVHLLAGFGVEIESGLDPAISVRRYGTDAPRRRFFDVLRIRRELRRVLLELKPDVLHAHYVQRYGWRAALSGFRPLVVSPWGSDLLRVRGRALRTRAWNWYTLRRADLVTVSSEGMRVVALRAGARPGRIQLVPHGVDTTSFSPGPVDPELRERIAPMGEHVIVSPRAIRPLYRQEVVVEALARLGPAAHRPVVVMSARNADAAYLADLQTRARALGVGDQLIVLDDVSQADLPALLRLAEVVVSVPETDSMPVTLLEAMACGRPVVASDLPAVSPVLREIDPLAQQLLVPIGDVDATASAIERAITLSDEERSRLGDALRAFVVRTADYETSMRGMEVVYRQLARR